MQKIRALGTSRGSQKSTEEDGPDSPIETPQFFTEEVLKMMGCEVPRSQRLRALKELQEIVKTKRLEKHAIESIWVAIEDLIDLDQPVEVRHAAFRFLSALIDGQSSSLGNLRAHFFEILKKHKLQEDLHERLILLQVLTNDGRSLLYIDDNIGPLAVELIEQAISAQRLETTKLFMSILVNIVQSNAVFMKEQWINQLVQNCSNYVSKNTSMEIIELMLAFLDALVCFGCLTSSALLYFITALCRTLNIERFCASSWETVKKMLGTHLGYSALVCMTRIIADRNNRSDVFLLRGAVFYISMSMWGPEKVTKLGNYFSPLLPSLKQAIQTKHTIVVYEVALSVLRLVKKYGSSLGPDEWNHIISLVVGIDQHVKEEGLEEANPLKTTLDEVFSTIEATQQNGCIIGVEDRFYEIIEHSSSNRLSSSIESLLRYKSSHISPDQPRWISTLCSLLERYYRLERRIEVRLASLSILSEKLDKYLSLYEETLIHDVVIPFLQTISKDQSSDVRKRGVEILVTVAEVCNPQWCIKIVNIINQVANHCITADQFLETRTSGGKGMKQKDNPQRQDAKIALFGLTNLFNLKFGRLPASIAVHIYELLVNHLTQHYNSSCFSETSSLIHMVIFQVILHLQSNEDGHIGYSRSEKTVKHTPFITCNPSVSAHQLVPTRRYSVDQSDPRRVSAAKIEWMDIQKAYEAILLCIQREVQWELLQSVLMDLPTFLSNHCLVYHSQLNLDHLIHHLCYMLQNPMSSAQPLQSLSAKPTTSDLSSAIYPVLSVLTSFTRNLKRTSQEQLINEFTQGLVGKESKLCLNSLTVCIFEMKEAVFSYRVVPAILQRLAQVSASSSMAIPVLDFLHSLSTLPRLFHVLTEKQFLTVFGILLPYTDASKYIKFVVSLAHRVQALWFIRSRLQYKKVIARFIVKTLMDDMMNLKLLEHQDGDEADTKTFHLETIQLCFDLLARYTFSIVSTQPSRSPLSDFLLSGGPSKTWLLKNFLVTITTSAPNKESIATCQRCSVNRSNLMEQGFSKDHDPKSSEYPYTLKQPSLCSCWSRGWAEVKIRRPSGCVSWLLRIQNQLDLHSSLDTLQTSHGWRDLGIGMVSYYQFNEEAPSKEEKQEDQSEDDKLVHQSDQPRESVFLSVSKSTEELKRSSENEENETLTEENSQLLGPFLVPTVQQQLVPNSSSSSVADREGEGSVCSASKAVYILSPVTSVHQYSSSVKTKFLPPLPSYEGDVRSPSLHSDETHLTEEQQIQLMNAMSEGTLSQSSAESLNNHEQESDEESIGEHFKMENLLEADNEYSNEGEDNPIVTEDDQEEVCTPRLVSLGDSVPNTPTEAPQPIFNAAKDHSPKEAGLYHQLEVDLRKIIQAKTARGGSIPGSQDTEIFNNPSFVFLQLYHSNMLDGNQDGIEPILLPPGEASERAIKILDHIPPYDTHKIGVVYVGEGQKSENEILGNCYGSERYNDFLKSLGQFVHLKDCDPELIYLGGLDRSGSDGELGCLWHDEITEVVFHVATLMPNPSNVGNHSNKKLHIGNDFVLIVYNHSRSKYNFGTIKGQFNFFEVIIEPLPHNCNQVTIEAKKGYEDLIDLHSTFVSDQYLGMFVRKLAIHANMACLLQGNSSAGPNLLSRLHQINRIKSKFYEARTSEDNLKFSDFSAFT